MNFSLGKLRSGETKVNLKGKHGIVSSLDVIYAYLIIRMS